MCYTCLGEGSTASWSSFDHGDGSHAGSIRWQGEGLTTAGSWAGENQSLAMAAAGMAAFGPWWEDAVDWVEEQTGNAIDWIETQAENVADWVADNVSAAPLNLFGTLSAIAPWSVSGVRFHVPDTADPDVKALFSGSQWSSASVTYSFPDSRWDYSLVNPSATGYRPLSFDSEQTTRYALEGYSPYAGGPKMGLTYVEGFTNLDFSYAGRNDATLRIAGFEAGDVIYQSHGYYPGVPLYGGDAWIKRDSGLPGNASYGTFLHELGHVLGLKHPHDEGYRLPKMSAAHDSEEYTLMSYKGTMHGAQTWMMYDIAALQEMYGADFVTRSGNTVYRWSPETGEAFVNGVAQGKPYINKIFQTIWDGGGTDTYDFSNYDGGMEVDLSPGGHSKFSFAQLARKNSTSYVKGNVYNAFQYKGDPRSLIENAIGGAGRDLITGNAAANDLKGGAGNDDLSGAGGNDVLNGGAGSDNLSGGAGTDLADYTGASAGIVADLTFTQNNTGDAAGDTYSGIEGLVGSSYGDVLIGDWRGNTLEGGSGDDVLNGREGADRLVGGSGTDTADYYNAAQGLYVSLVSPHFNTGEAAGDSYVSIEGISGSQHGDTLVGNLGGNVLNGGAGNDTLEGLAGSDVLDGGSGRDVAGYFFATDFGDPGVYASLIAPHLNTGHAAGDVYASIEGLSGSRGADTLIGDHSANLLMGDAGDDLIDGLYGNDELWGGAGRDRFAFGTSLNESANVDRIMDFNAAEDQILLHRSFFWIGGAAGALQAGAFRVGAAAATTGERIVYNPWTGDLFFDADGAGSGAQVKFATLSAGLSLSAGNFVLV